MKIKAQANKDKDREQVLNHITMEATKGISVHHKKSLEHIITPQKPT